MPLNQYLPIANSPTANAETAAQWAAMSAFLQQGFSSGEVLSSYFNTFLRQFSVPISAIAQFVADNQTADVLDDGSVANFEAKFEAALLSFVDREGIAFAVDGGTSDALSGTPVPALTAYRAGQVVAIQKNASVATNATATPTVNLNGLGAVTIVKASGMPLYAGDLPQGGLFFAVYDGQYFRHIGLTLSTAGLLTQAGQAVVFTAAGTNAYTGTLTPAPVALSPRMEVLGFFGTPNTSAAAPTLLLNGIGSALPILKQGGGVPSAGDVSGVVPLVLNTAGTAWLINGLATSDVLALIQANTLTLLRQNLTVYVRPDGSDTNNGLTDTAAGAFKTPQGAYNALTKAYILSGFSITIQLSKTYAPGSITSYPGLFASNVGVNGAITLVGDAANSGNYKLTPVSAGDGSMTCCLSAIPTLTATGVTADLSSLASGSGTGFRAAGGGILAIGTVGIFCPVSNAGISPVGGDIGSQIIQAGTITFSGGGTVGNVFNLGGSYGPVAASTIAISNFTFTNFFLINGGKANLQLLTFSGSGNTGSRYSVIENGVLDPSSLALSSIPGSTIGSTASGGQAIGDLGNGWTAYNGGITSTNAAFGSATVACRYQRIGKIVFGSIQITITTVGSATGAILTQLPFQPLSGVSFAGAETAVTGKTIRTSPTSASGQIGIANYDNSSAIVAGGSYFLTFMYEAAA